MANLSRGMTAIRQIVAISRTVAVHAQAWVQGSLTAILPPGPTPPDTEHILRVPLTAPITRPTLAQPTFATNLLLTTLAVTAAAPFAQADFPNPIAPRAVHTGFVQGLMPQDMPFAQTDWPNPTLAAPRQQPANSLDILRTTLGPAPTKTASLQDTFNAGYNAALWDLFEDPGSTITFIRNRVEVQAPNGQASPAVSYATIQSKAAYDLTESSAHVELIQPVNAVEPDIAGTGLTASVNPVDGTRYALGIAVYPDWTLFYRFVGGAYADVAASIPYDPVAHRWLRLRHSGTTAYWDTSADGVTWTNRATWTPSFYLGSVYVSVYSGLEDTATNPTLAAFDNLNTGADPALQYDFPNPGIPRASHTGFVSPTPAELLATPFAQALWPNPAPRPWADRSDPLGGQQLTEEIFPFIQTDWPNPVLRVVRPQPDYTSTRFANVAYTPPPDPFVPCEFPNPLRAMPRYADHAASLQYDQLSTVPLLPLAWPNPVRSPVRHQDWTNALVYDRLIQVQEAPFVQATWPNPVLRTRTIQDLTWTNGLVPDQLNAVPTIQDEWPNPVLRIRTVVPVMHRYAGEPVAPAGAAPFAQLEWPNPAPRPRAVYAAASRVLGDEMLPFTQSEWPNPAPRRVPQQPDYTANAVTTTSFTEPLTPNIPGDWPNPARPRPVPDAACVAVPLTLASTVLSPMPFGFWEWPNPVRRVPYQLAPTFPHAVEDVPFAQADWPNPVRRTPQHQASESGPIRTAFSPVQPFAQPNWPNPVRRVRTVHDLTHHTTPLITTLSLTNPKPFHQDTWPNPVRRIRTVQDLSFTSGQALWIPDILPYVSDLFRRHGSR